MDLSKSFEYFDPAVVDGPIHIIGCGSVGSTIAENLVRMGLSNIELYDFDTVEAHNIVNQMFTYDQIGKPKVEATKELLERINPEVKTTIIEHGDGYCGQPLSGYVFLCVDSIELRHEICKNNLFNMSIKAVFDVRTRLEDAQMFATEWDPKSASAFMKTMEFTHDEAAEATPVSSCGVVLGVATTVRVVCGICASNFINYIRTGKLMKGVICNPFSGTAFEM